MTYIVIGRPLAGSKGSAEHSLKPPHKLATDFQSTPRRETLEPFWYSSASVVTKANYNVLQKHSQDYQSLKFLRNYATGILKAN